MEMNDTNLLISIITIWYIFKRQKLKAMSIEINTDMELQVMNTNEDSSIDQLSITITLSTHKQTKNPVCMYNSIYANRVWKNHIRFSTISDALRAY